MTTVRPTVSHSRTLMHGHETAQRSLTFRLTHVTEGGSLTRLYRERRVREVDECGVSVLEARPSLIAVPFFSTLTTATPPDFRETHNVDPPVFLWRTNSHPGRFSRVSVPGGPLSFDMHERPPCQTLARNTARKRLIEPKIVRNHQTLAESLGGAETEGSQKKRELERRSAPKGATPALSTAAHKDDVVSLDRQRDVMPTEGLSTLFEAMGPHAPTATPRRQWLVT
jgi:hypothetical protein